MRTIRGQKYLWNIPELDHQQMLAIATRFNLCIAVAQTLVSRGFTTIESVENYLFTSLEKDVAHPSLLKDAQKAVARIMQAINNQEKILIFGDYDVDGITSSALMMLCLKPVGAQINFFLPNRMKDGYGLSVGVVERAAQNGYSVIITVDNGITAFEPAKRAQKLGIDLIITDHHRPHQEIPIACAVINPHQVDCHYPYKKFAGVGVTFKLLSLLYEHLALQMPSKAFELLLLGTIADVVPLTGENRFWVRYGLQYINQTESHAFKVLKQNGKVIKEKLSASDIGYGLTPQINALGRLQDPRQGVKFLIGDDQQEIEHIGRILAELNQARKEIEKSIFSEISTAIATKKIDLDKENIIFAASSQWPSGVIGLVASRLVGAYGKPVVLLHLTKDGIAKGSCRSITAFNMFDALSECHDLLLTFGGHSVAAGLSLVSENLEALKNRLETILATKITPEELQQKLTIDAHISLFDVTKKVMTDMGYLEPFGNENPQPIFYIPNVTLVQSPILMKDLHVKCMVFAEGIIKPVVFFNAPDLFEKFKAQGEEPFDVAVHVTENHWNGKSNIELLGIDVAGLGKYKELA